MEQPTKDELQETNENQTKSIKECQGEKFYIYNYYELHKIVGQGAYGVVCSATDTRNNNQVAIKKIKNIYVDLIDSKRILREIKLLKFLNHKNIIKLIQVIQCCNENHKDLYLVFDLMQANLQQVINSKMPLNDEHIRFFMFQILLGIYYMHSGDVIHRDLKPDNLLVNKKCQLKIADLGLARKFESINMITDYVVTRWY